jgi:Spy/CpxP family protein refolding chaperone
MQRGWKSAALTLAATIAVAGSASAQGRGFGFGFGPMGGGGAMLLRMPEVQTELKLTDEQKTKVDVLMEQIRDERRGAFQELQGQGPEAFQKKLLEWRASEEKQISALLTAGQQKRYRQLQLQQQGIAAVADKSLADELKLTEEQRTHIQTVLDEQRQSMRPPFGGRGGPGGPGGPPPSDGGPPPGGGFGAGPGGRGGPGGFDPQAMRARMEAQRKQTEEKVTALLTDAQKQQWKEMLGAPFTFPAFRPGGPGGPSGPPRAELRPAT